MKISTLSAIAILALSSSAFADISLVNKTNFYGTAKFDNSPCSSKAGPFGTVKPNSTFNVPNFAISHYCGSTSCTAHVYMNTSCEGKEAVIVTLDAKNGVTNFTNLDPKHLDIQGSGHTITVNPIAGFGNWIRGLFF